MCAYIIQRYINLLLFGLKIILELSAVKFSDSTNTEVSLIVISVVDLIITKTAELVRFIISKVKLREKLYFMNVWFNICEENIIVS